MTSPSLSSADSNFGLLRTPIPDMFTTFKCTRDTSRQCGREGYGSRSSKVCGFYNYVKNKNHQLYMDRFFSGVELFRDLAKDKIFCCGTIQANRKHFPGEELKKAYSTGKKVTLKQGEQHFLTNDENMSAVAWQDKKLSS